ncbi:MMPL family transporter [Amycolatopsis sp. NBC_01286]|uniref:MMPL family transporter n=1 Tax=Amycolatopsis sp. NBC_01286 TaxID=2903560 RepID=UPI002E1484CB|nr:MMPL family transporter [Amycolatopsis sp. NBC_01286]
MNTSELLGMPPERPTARTWLGPLQRAAELIARRPKTVLAAWLLVIAACTPFAFQLDSVLTQQGASKVVPSTSSAAVEQMIEQDFPQRSQRQTLLVITAPDVRNDQVKRMLAGTVDRLAERVERGEIDQVDSPMGLYQDAVVRYLTVLRQQITTQAGPTAGATARQAVVDQAVVAGQVPGELADAARAAVAASDATVASELASAARTVTFDADWADFPVPVPAEAVNQLISPSRRAALVPVSFAKSAGANPDVASLRQLGERMLADNNLAGVAEVHVTGELALIDDTYAQAEADNAIMELAAYGIITVILLLFFRAVVPTLVTLVSIGLAMNVSQAALFSLGHAVTLTQFTVTIMTFVMLGAGVDYSMLLSSRYRQERLAGRSVHDAAVHATVHAGESVLLAGGAVAVAFGATLLSPVDWIPPLGYGGLVGIPIIMSAALTLTPALLVLLGDRFFALGRNSLGDMESTGILSRYLRRVSTVAKSRRYAVAALFLVITMPFAWITATHDSTADPVELSPDNDSKHGFETVAAEWGPGMLLPTLVTGPIAPDQHKDGEVTEAGYQGLADLGERIAKVPGVAEVDSITRPFGIPVPFRDVATLPKTVRQDFVSESGIARIVVKLSDEPYSDAAVDTVARVERVVAETGEVGQLQVGGATRVDTQYDDALRSSFWQMIALVSGGVFVMLLFALRSVVIPLHLIATIMMSNIWALAITALIFDTVLGIAIINDLPIFLIILMMGLGMDYEIFLVTRVKDLMRGGLSTMDATMQAVIDTGRVITSAGLVMAGSLGTMVLSSTVMLQQYGTSLAIAVLLDATLIRMLFVPATLVIFDHYNWWLPTRRRGRRDPATAK